MIAKNEVDRKLAAALAAAAPHVTAALLCDTGSTDATVEQFQTFFDSLNITVAVERHDWRDFATNRNLCLAAAAAALGPACDYHLLLDADQIMASDKGILLPELDLSQPAYWLRERCWGTEYSNRRLVSATYDWRYSGKVHEYIEPVGRGGRAFAGMEPGEAEAETAAAWVAGALPPSVFSLHDSEYARSFDRDLALLQAAIEEDPADERAHFYKGNTLRVMGRRDDAFLAWAARVELGGWEEEVYLSMLGIANELEEAWEEGDPVAGPAWAAAARVGAVAPNEGGEGAGVEVALEDVVSAYKAAHESLPYRKEAPYHLAKLYRTELDDGVACAAWAQQAAAGGPHHELTMFAERDIYRFGVLDELCTCAARAAGGVAAGRAACEALLEALRQEPVDPATDEIEWNRLRIERVQGNLDWYVAAAEGGGSGAGSSGSPVGAD